MAFGGVVLATVPGPHSATVITFLIMILVNFFYNILYTTFNSASGGWTQISKIINSFNTFLMLLIIFGLVIFRTIEIVCKNPKRAIKLP